MAKFQELESAYVSLNEKVEKNIALMKQYIAIANSQSKGQADLATKTNAAGKATQSISTLERERIRVANQTKAVFAKSLTLQEKGTRTLLKAKIRQREEQRKLNEELKKELGVVKKSGGLFRSMTKSILAAGAAFFGANAIINGVKTLVSGLFELSKQMQGESVRATVVFGKQLEYVQQEADILSKKMGVTSREFVSMAAATADLLIPLDFTRKQAAEMSVELQGLTGALDEWTAGSVGAKEISEILTKAMLGENEQLKRLGIAIRKDTDEYRDLVKIKLQTTGTTKAQAEALATLELIQKKSTDAQTAYTQSGNRLLRLEKEFKRVIREKKENFIKLFDVEKEQPNLYRLENKELNILFGSLRNVNLSQDARNKLITTINDKYGKYLPNLLTEQSTLEDIAEAEKAINKQLRLKVIQQAFQEEINKLIKDELQAKKNVVDNEIRTEALIQERIQSAGKLSKQEQENAELFIKISNDIANAQIENNEKEIESTEDKFKRIGELYGIAFSEIEAVLNENTETVKTNNIEQAEAYEELLKKVKKQLERLNKELGSDKGIEGFAASIAAIEAEIEELVNNEEQTVLDSIDTTEKAKLKSYEDDIIAYNDYLQRKKALEEQLASDTEQAVQTIITDQFNAGIDNRLATFNADQAAKEAILKDNLDKGLINEKQFENKLAALKLKSRQEEAKASKKKALFEIAINTALGIVKTIGSVGFPAAIPLIILTAAIGAIQAAVVAAKPIPKFEHGTNGQLQLATDAIVSEGGQELVTTPKGAFLTPKEESLVHLPAKSTVFPNYSPETQAALNGGMTTEQYQGLINEQRLTRKAILNQPKESLNITGKGWVYSAKKTNERIKFIDKYFRGQ